MVTKSQYAQLNEQLEELGKENQELHRCLALARRCFKPSANGYELSKDKRKIKQFLKLYDSINKTT